MNLEKFLIGITKLRIGSTPYGLAPHKPILLLTILDLLDRGILTTFWSLRPVPGHLITKSIKSIQTLSSVVEYTCFSDVVFQMLTQKDNRDAIRSVVVNFYFPSKTDLYFRADKLQGTYLKEVQQYVLNKVPKVMRLQVAEEEMVYVRNWTFKKMVPMIYQNTCAISGMKVISNNGRSLIDACHITPFSSNQDDKVTNGIALCPNLHRAFDHGLVSIDQDYRVLVSKQVIEDELHPYGLANLKGKKIILPGEKHLWPSQENLEEHRQRKFLS